MPQIRRSVLATSASLLTAAVLVVAPSAAHADSSNAAARIVFDNCLPEIGFCSEGTSLIRFGEPTASGNLAVTFHLQATNTFSFDGCNGQTQERQDNSYVLKPDGSGAYHYTINGQTILQCPDSTPTTCEYSYLFTLANGEVRLNIVNDCTPAAADIAAAT